MTAKTSSRRAKYLQAAFLTLGFVGAATAASAALTPFEAKQKQRQLVPVYEQSIAKGAPVRPWKNSDVEVIGKIVYPRLKQSAIVLSTATEEALDAGPSLAPDSVAIGSPGVSVIAAHRDTHFAFLRYAKVGDLVQAAGADGKMRDYRVTRLEIVNAEDFVVPLGLNENRLALYTCYPFKSQRLGPKRFVVHAELVS